MLIASTFLASPNNLFCQAITDAQTSLNNIHLKVGATNVVLTAGSTAFITIQIENVSTHSITIVGRHVSGSGVLPDFVAKLIDAHGKVYRLTANSKLEPNASVPPLTLINAGETKTWNVSLIIKKAVLPGDYLLQITQKVSVNGSRYFEIVSNLITVTIKQP
jgi:uncharacterized membrane protein